MRKRLTMALAAGALVAAMAPGVASAAQDQTNLGQCIAEAKQALKGTGIKLKVGQFDDIVLGTNGDDILANPPGPTLICGFGGGDLVDTIDDADDVFAGGDGGDIVGVMSDGLFDGGPGPDFAITYNGGTCRSVESVAFGGPCPAP